MAQQQQQRQTRKERRDKFVSRINTTLDEELTTDESRKGFKESIKGQWRKQAPETYFGGVVKANVKQRLLHIIEIERKQLLRAEEFITDEIDAWVLDEDNPGKAHDEGIELVNHIEKHLYTSLERKKHIANQAVHARHVVNDTLEENWGKKTVRTVTETAGKIVAAPVTVPLAVGKGVVRGIGKAVGIGRKD